MTNFRTMIYASGPFTRIEFVVHQPSKALLIAVPKLQSVGEKGDLVPTLLSHTMPRRYY